MYVFYEIQAQFEVSKHGSSQSSSRSAIMTLFLVLLIQNTPACEFPIHPIEVTENRD